MIYEKNPKQFFNKIVKHFPQSSRCISFYERKAKGKDFITRVFSQNSLFAPSAVISSSLETCINFVRSLRKFLSDILFIRVKFMPSHNIVQSSHYT